MSDDQVATHLTPLRKIGKLTGIPIPLTHKKTKKGKRKRRQKAAEVASLKTGIGVAEIKAAFALLKHCVGIVKAREALVAAVEIQKVL